jgi:hypothetical protein
MSANFGDLKSSLRPHEIHIYLFPVLLHTAKALAHSQRRKTFCRYLQQKGNRTRTGFIWFTMAPMRGLFPLANYQDSKLSRTIWSRKPSTHNKQGLRWTSGRQTRQGACRYVVIENCFVMHVHTWPKIQQSFRCQPSQCYGRIVVETRQSLSLETPLKR